MYISKNLYINIELQAVQNVMFMLRLQDNEKQKT